MTRPEQGSDDQMTDEQALEVERRRMIEAQVTTAEELLTAAQSATGPG